MLSNSQTYAHPLQPLLCRSLLHVLSLYSDLHESRANAIQTELIAHNDRLATLQCSLRDLEHEYAVESAHRAAVFARCLSNLTALQEARKEARRTTLAAWRIRRDTRFWNVVGAPVIRAQRAMRRDSGLNRADQVEAASNTAERAAAEGVGKVVEFAEGVRAWREMYMKVVAVKRVMEETREEIGQENGGLCERGVEEMRWMGFWNLVRERVEECIGGKIVQECMAWRVWCAQWGVDEEDGKKLSEVGVEELIERCDELTREVEDMRERAATLEGD